MRTPKVTSKADVTSRLTIPKWVELELAPMGCPTASHACSSSHGRRGCFHVIQPI